MSGRERITAEVSDQLACFVRRAVSSGAYKSVDAVITDALMTWIHSGRAQPLTDEDIRGLVQTGMEGEAIPAEEVFDRLTAKYRAMAKARDAA